VKKLSILTCSIFLLVLLSACSQSGSSNQESSQTAQKADSSAAELLTSVKTTQAFADEKIPSEDVEAILKAGVNAPSAMNTQPWHFSVVTDKAVLEKISGDMSGGMPAGGAPPKGAVPPIDASQGQGIPPQGEAGKVPSDPPPGLEGKVPSDLPPGMEGKVPSDLLPSMGALNLELQKQVWLMRRWSLLFPVRQALNSMLGLLARTWLQRHNYWDMGQKSLPRPQSRSMAANRQNTRNSWAHPRIIPL